MDEADKVIAAIARKLGGSQAATRKALDLDPFTFNINFLPLAASNNATDQFITQADSGFAIVKTCFVIASNVDVFVANISDTPKYAPLLVMLSDSGSGRNLSNSPVAVNNYFGTAERPFIWSRPKVLDPNSTFVAQVQNLVATAFNVRFAFQGFKIFGDVSLFKSR